MILERRLQVPDRNNQKLKNFFPLEVKLEGIGPGRKMPSTLTAIVESRDWIDQGNGHYSPDDERTLCYEFSLSEITYWEGSKKKTVPKGALVRMSIHEGYFHAQGFRYLDTRIDETSVIESPPNFRHHRQVRRFNHRVTDAYILIEDIDIQLRGERQHVKTTRKEKDELDYFLRALNILNYFEYERHLHFPMPGKRRVR